MHKVLNNKQTIEDKLIVCLSNIFLPSLIDMHLTQGKREHSNIICEDSNKIEKESLNRMKNPRQISLMGQGVMRINWA